MILLKNGEYMTVIRFKDLSEDSKRKIFMTDKTYHKCSIRDEFLTWLDEMNIKMNVSTTRWAGSSKPAHPRLLTTYFTMWHFTQLYFEFESEEDMILFKLTWS